MPQSVNYLKRTVERREPQQALNISVAALEIGRPVLTFAAALVEYFAELEKCLLPFGIPRTNLNLHHRVRRPVYTLFALGRRC